MVKLTTERFRLRHVTTHRRTLRQRQTIRMACRTNCIGNYDKKTTCIYSNMAHNNQDCHLAFLKIPNQPNWNYFNYFGNFFRKLSIVCFFETANLAKNWRPSIDLQFKYLSLELISAYQKHIRCHIWNQLHWLYGTQFFL